MALIMGERGRYAGFFFLLLLLFVAVRFPYDEVKEWGLSRVSRAVGAEIEVKDVDILFPLGIGMNGLSFRGGRDERSFRLSGIESVAIKVSPAYLLVGKRVIGFTLRNGGECKGRVIFGEDGVEVELDSDGIEIGGAGYGREFVIEEGLVTASVDMVISGDPANGGGALSLSGSDLLLKGINPLLPELVIKGLRIDMVKEGRVVSINSVDLDIGGVILAGRGSINLKRELGKSEIEIVADVDAGEADEGPLKELLPMIAGIGGRGERFQIALSGELGNPRLEINGKRFM